MAPITTIVHFEVPPENVERFFSYWRQNQEGMSKQPGLVGGTLYRATDPNGPFQFVNVARWESAEALAASFPAAEEALQREGIDRDEVLKELGVKITQSNFTEAVEYRP